ncbi:hypothetical protein [Desulfobacter vibrioformis]|uniref:hypothetical protein n=1 Tax=Desulfobacter vibrioformis TaxID=34031 RepID=UPI0012EC0F11|nr:hypothetical protein [Desulfobacter vibrioformis]
MVVINPAAVRLTTASIRTAIRSFKETLPNLLVSCSLFREHPCQYNLYTSVMDAGSVDFTDGCCVNVNLSSPLVRFKRKAISTIEMMFAPYVTDNDLLLQTVPLNSGVPDWNASEQFFIPKGKCRVAWTPVKQYEGCMYTLMKIVKDGWCDCLTPLVSAFLPWKLDSYSDVTRVLRDTGTPIQGRQNFPDLLQPNRVIAVADSVSSLLRTPSELHVRPLVLENSESIVIEDEVDWFQHSAAMEMA